MSDTNECCICYKPTKHLTPCNHLICESCYSQVPTCPMHRALFFYDVPSSELDDDDNSEDCDSKDNYETIPATLINATCLGSEETAQLALDRIVDPYNEAMVAASNSGHESIVRLLLDKGANSYNCAMLAAAVRTGHETIVRLVLEKGANNYNETMIDAARKVTSLL